MILLCLIKKKRKNIIFEYDDQSIKDNLFDIFKSNELNDINVNEINKENILYVKLLNKNLSCEYIKSENTINYSFETNDFEIIAHRLNGDKCEKKIINIKTFFNKEIKNMIPTEIEKRIESIEKKLEEMPKEKEELKEEMSKEKEELKEEMSKEKEDLKEEINSNKNVINKLNAKIEILLEDKKKYDTLKGRFIYRAFIDYLFLIFDIKIDLEYSDKKRILKTNSGKYYRDVLLIIKKMKDLYLYYGQTKITHADPTYDEITASILDYYDEEDDYYMYEIMKQLKPQEEIKKIIIKNNELTKVMLGKESSQEKEKKIKEINEQINALIPNFRKAELVKMLEKILEEEYE